MRRTPAWRIPSAAGMVRYLVAASAILPSSFSGPGANASQPASRPPTSSEQLLATKMRRLQSRTPNSDSHHIRLCPLNTSVAGLCDLPHRARLVGRQFCDRQHSCVSIRSTPPPRCPNTNNPRRNRTVAPDRSPSSLSLIILASTAYKASLTGMPRAPLLRSCPPPLSRPGGNSCSTRGIP